MNLSIQYKTLEKSKSVHKENSMKEMIELRTEINEYGPISLTTLETKMLNAQPNQTECVCVCVCVCVCMYKYINRM